MELLLMSTHVKNIVPKLKLSLALLFVIVANACGSDFYEIESRSQIVGVAASEHLWQTNEIPVCWENAGTSSQNFREKVKIFVNANVNSRNTKVAFSGWGTCTATFNGVRIFIFDDPDLANSSTLIALASRLARENIYPGHPFAFGLGKQLAAKNPGIVLSMNYGSVEPFLIELKNQYKTPTAQQNILMTSSLHEFGHALGLLHEDAHPHPDVRLSICASLREPLGTGTVLGSYNEFSIMNRCYYRYSYDYSSHALGMNEEDFSAIRQLYNFLP